MTIINPIILGVQLPTGDYDDALREALLQAERFFDSYGMLLDLRPIEKYATTAIDSPLANPWTQVAQFCQWLLETDEKAVVFLEGWDVPGNRGWGGNPVAVLGEYAIRILVSKGTPEAIVDDGITGGIIGHEIGHVLGYGHDLVYPNNIMWTGCYNFPNTYPSLAMTDAARGGSPARLMGTHDDGPCPLS